MFTKVLFPTDFSDEADKTLEYLLGFKKFGLKEILLVHIVNIKSTEFPLTKTNERKIKSFLKNREKKIKEEEIKVKTFSVVGIPEIEILKIDKKENTSLIATGSHGKSLIEELLIGSVSERIGRKAKTPVLIIRYSILKEMEKIKALENWAEHAFEKILFPTDFSSCSDTALNYLKKLKGINNKNILVFHVIDDRSLETELEKEELKKISKEKLKKIQKELKEASFKTETYLRTGDPLGEIVEKAEEKDVSLILMGSHGKSVFQEWLVGSISLNVVRIAEKPALIVHEEDTFVS